MSIATTDDERKLVTAIEEMTGGTVTALTRQPRWRPAWFADVLRDGETIHVHARGDRQSDMMPFPELEREAHIMMALEEVGVMVPHIYGFCRDPEAIIMETVPGTRDVATAPDDAARHRVVQQYVAQVAKIHAAPLEPFARRGIEIPEGAEAIALAGLHAYEPLYRRTKVKPEPLIEFALQWLRRNVPMHRTKAAFVQYDSGQFLFDGDQLTCVYDFEFGMVSDPMADLATMRMRESVEPIGCSFTELLDYYEQATGQPVDDAVLRFYNTMFSAVAAAQFVGTLGNPKPGDPHDVYLEWDIALRRVLTQILAETMGMTIDQPDPSWMGTPAATPRFAMLSDMIDAIAPDGEMARQKKEAASRIAEYLGRTAQHQSALDHARRADAEALLGRDMAPGEDMDAVLEAFVLSSGPERDADLLRYFHADIERQVQLLGDTRIGMAAKAAVLPPLRRT